MFQFNLLTDNFGDETSFRLEKATGSAWQEVLSGPSNGSGFQANSEYTYALCLPSGFNYRLIMADSYGDGLCCEAGDGSYSFLIDGAVQFDSKNEGHTFGQQSVHDFTIGTVVDPVALGASIQESFQVSYGNYGAASQDEQVELLIQPEPEPEPVGEIPTYSPTPPLTPQPTSSPTPRPSDPEPQIVTPFDGRSSVCGSGMQQVRIKIQFDKWAKENSWELRNTDTGEKVTGEPMGTYSKNDFETLMVCLEDGNYRFTIFDDFGNGICCSEGNGYYELSMDDEVIVYDLFGTGKQRSSDFLIGYYSNLAITQRELDYLNEHNTRREHYHKKYGTSYVPLKYSSTLAADARAWAEELLNDCDVDGIKHDPNRGQQGENLAKAVGHYSEWGELKPVTNIVTRWVEREETWVPPENFHFMQALWRATRYVGCGESVKNMDDGKVCRIQVCRYTRPGNCDIGDGKDWKKLMLADHSPCGEDCPPGGCI